MSKLNLANVVVGNEFVVPQPKIRVVAPITAPVPVAPAMAAPAPTAAPATPVLDDLNLDFEATPHKSFPGKVLDFVHHYSLGTFALLLLAVASAAIMVGGSYWQAHMDIAVGSVQHRTFVKPVQGPNTTVRTADLDVTLQSITSQPLNLSINGKDVAVSADTIKSWLKVVSNKAGVSYIHADQDAISKSLNEAAKPYIKAPVNQVFATAADGSQQTVATGKNGTKIGDLTPLTQQVTRDLISAKGMQLIVPTETQAFAVVPISSFDKVIEVNVTSKQMWLYEKGQLYKQYPISAGAAETPTPLGQFQIYSKLTVQDMRGFNPNGTKYFQPHVRWINYFLPGGYAVHGNYWRPLSYFGTVNSSHGCVSLPDDQAKTVYDWAPIGTTVITHS